MYINYQTPCAQPLIEEHPESFTARIQQHENRAVQDGRKVTWHRMVQLLRGKTPSEFQL